MKRIMLNTFFVAMMITGITVMSCKDDKQNNDKVDSMEATRPEDRDRDVTVEPDNGMEMDTMTRTASDSITTP